MIAHRKMNNQTGEVSDVQPDEAWENGYTYFLDEAAAFTQEQWDALDAYVKAKKAQSPAAFRRLYYGDWPAINDDVTFTPPSATPPEPTPPHTDAHNRSDTQD